MPFDVLDRILRPLRARPVTSRYPDAPPNLPLAARGLPMLEVSRCDGNAACVSACPTGAIVVAGSVWSIDAGACVFCGYCARACPSDAIRLGSLIELAVREPADLVVECDWQVDR